MSLNLSQDVGRTDFSENLCASLVNNDLAKELLSARYTSLDSTFAVFDLPNPLPLPLSIVRKGEREEERDNKVLMY